MYQPAITVAFVGTMSVPTCFAFDSTNQQLRGHLLVPTSFAFDGTNQSIRAAFVITNLLCI
jgi:hypothetical protein